MDDSRHCASVAEIENILKSNSLACDYFVMAINYVPAKLVYVIDLFFTLTLLPGKTSVKSSKWIPNSWCVCVFHRIFHKKPQHTAKLLN